MSSSSRWFSSIWKLPSIFCCFLSGKFISFISFRTWIVQTRNFLKCKFSEHKVLFWTAQNLTNLEPSRTLGPSICTWWTYNFWSTILDQNMSDSKNMKQPQFGCSLEKWTSATFPPLSLYFQDFFSQQRSSRPNSRSCAMQSCCGKFANWGRKWKVCGFPSSSVFQACLPDCLPSGLAAPLSHPNVVHIFHV